MLSYQHAYHAGNFADVHKHALLARLLGILIRSPQALSITDTHAGRGFYDLSGEEAQKTGEHRFGISSVYRTHAKETILSDYFKIIQGLNPDDALRIYPGSPWIAQSFLRKQDNLLLMEKHPAEYAALQENMEKKPGVVVEKGDGFSYLESLRPGQNKRALVIVDPSYEVKSEYETLPRVLAKARKAWPKAIFFIWYPLLPAQGHVAMLESLHRLCAQDTLVSEIALQQAPQESFGMTGSGIILANAPFGFDAVTKEIADKVADLLPMTARAHCFWLNNLKLNAETGRVIFP